MSIDRAGLQEGAADLTWLRGSSSASAMQTFVHLGKTLRKSDFHSRADGKIKLVQGVECWLLGVGQKEARGLIWRNEDCFCKGIAAEFEQGISKSQSKYKVVRSGYLSLPDKPEKGSGHGRELSRGPCSGSFL